MTKSQEGGENEITIEAKKVARRTRKDVCDVLAAMLAKAKKDDDKERI
jgi:hypothetical protein